MTSAMDALGFGANILAFITLTAQLTKLTAQVYGSLADAPDSIQRSLARLDHLERLLIQIDTNIEQHPTLITDQRFRQHWDSRIVAMRLERARLRTFIDGLNAIESAKEKIEWLWTNQKALRAIIQRFCEDVDVLFQHHQILIQTSIHQSLDQIKTTMVTKQEFFQLQGQTLTSVAAPRTSVLIRQRRRKTDGSRSLVSIMGTARTYRLPFGKVRILYGWKCTDSDENGDKLGLLGVWCFEPEPWFSHHNIYTRATVLCRFSKDNSHPSITRTLKTSVIVSDLHPVRQCLENGDIPGFQNLLCIGAVSIYDTFTGGWSLLHSVFYPQPNRLLNTPSGASR